MLAVNSLTNLCFESGLIQLVAVKQMLKEGALESLLTICRTLESPEVELQIAMIISVLVTYEDDWSLLQKSAYEILSELYTLQLKALRTATSHVDENDDKFYSLNTETRDVFTLVSAAVAKLSLVLSLYWGNLEKQVGALTSSQITALTFRNCSSGGSGNSTSTRPRSLSNSANGNSNESSSKVLETLINVILTICKKPSQIGIAELEQYSNASSCLSDFTRSTFHQPNCSVESILMKNMHTLSTDSFLSDAPTMTASKMPPIDNATVLCSASLSNLSEVATCRPWLEKGGALKILKSWLEVCINVLTQAKRICLMNTASVDDSEEARAHYQ